MDQIDCFIDYTTKMSDEEFNAKVASILDDGREDDQSEWTMGGQKIFNVMVPTLMSYVNFSMNYNSYIANREDNDVSVLLNNADATISGCEKFVVHPHDIMLYDYTIIEPISFIQFSKMIKEIEEPNVAVLALSYKKCSFNVSVIEYVSNQEKYKEAYKTGNIALYFLPRTIKRLSGNASAKGKDIIAQFNDRLIKYGYRIEKGKVKGIAHDVTDYDADNIAKVLRKINNNMHD